MSQPYSKREGSRGTSGVKRDGRRTKDERTESSAWSSLNLVGGGAGRERQRDRDALSQRQKQKEKEEEEEATRDPGPAATALDGRAAPPGCGRLSAELTRTCVPLDRTQAPCRTGSQGGRGWPGHRVGRLAPLQTGVRKLPNRILPEVLSGAEIPKLN